MVIHRVVDAMVAFVILVPVALLVAYGILGEAYNLRHSGIIEGFYSTASQTLSSLLHLHGLGRDLENATSIQEAINTTIIDYIGMHGVTVPLPHLRVKACAYTPELYLAKPCIEAGRGNTTLVKSVSATIGVSRDGTLILKVYRVYASG